MSRGLEAAKRYAKKKRKRHYGHVDYFAEECYVTAPVSIAVSSKAKANAKGDSVDYMWWIFQQVMRFAEDGKPCIPDNEIEEFRKTMPENIVLEFMQSFPSLSKDDLEVDDHEEAETAKKPSKKTKS